MKTVWVEPIIIGNFYVAPLQGLMMKSYSRIPLLLLITTLLTQGWIFYTSSLDVKKNGQTPLNMILCQTVNCNVNENM